MTNRGKKPGSGGDAQTLTDDQIKTRAKIGRRALLLSAGAGVAGAGTILVPEAQAQSCTDNDVGNYADPAGRGRGTGFSDSDSGAYADLAGCGRGRRGGGGRAGPSDGDSGQYADPAGQGRSGVRTGISDSDSGRWADPPSGGRWGSRLTDSDDGPYFSDQAGNGRRGW